MSELRSKQLLLAQRLERIPTTLENTIRAGLLPVSKTPCQGSSPTRSSRSSLPLVCPRLAWPRSFPDASDQARSCDRHHCKGILIELARHLSRSDDLDAQLEALAPGDDSFKLYAKLLTLAATEGNQVLMHMRSLRLPPSSRYRAAARVTAEFPEEEEIADEEERPSLWKGRKPWEDPAYRPGRDPNFPRH